MSQVFVNGQFLEETQLLIPLSDRGFLWGDGLFTTVRVEEGEAQAWMAHIDRLQAGCEELKIRVSLPTLNQVNTLIGLNEAQKGVWRLKVIVTGGDERDFFLPLRLGRVIMFLQPFRPPVSASLRVGIYPTEVLSTPYKSLSYGERLKVVQDAKERGYDDCLTQTRDGILLETSIGNLFWVIDGTLFTPSPTLPLYFGVTIRRVLAKAKREGFNLYEVESRLADIPKEAAIFRTNSLCGVMPIESIEGENYNKRSPLWAADKG